MTKHIIIGEAHIEATQRGFIVWVKTNKRNKAQLTDANEDYEAVKAAAASIDKGRWVSIRHSKGATFHVRGRVLTVEQN